MNHVFPPFRSYGHEFDATIQAAFKTALAEVDDTCCDNYRIADVAIPAEVEGYEAAVDKGCCGFFESTVEVSGRTFRIGFNYGH
jgi:hypothetical protein